MDSAENSDSSNSATPNPRVNISDGLGPDIVVSSPATQSPRRTMYVSATSMKKQLQDQLNEYKLQLDKTANLGSALLKQKTELEERIKDLDKTEDDEVPQDLKDKIAALQQEAKALDANTTDVFAKGTSTGGLDINALGSPSSNTPASDASSTPAAPLKGKARYESKKGKPPKRDIELAAEIGHGLLQEVKRLTILLQEKEEGIKKLEIDKAELERAIEILTKQLRAKEEAEAQIKDDNWNLELTRQELSNQLENLQQQLNRARNDYTKIEKALATATDVIEQLKDKEEKLISNLENLSNRHEKDMANNRRHVTALNREKNDLLKEVGDLKTQLDSISATRNMRKRTPEPGAEPTNRDGELSSNLETSGIPAALQGKNLSLEEALKALNVSHRMIGSLRTNLQKEKSEKYEVKKLLSDSQEQIEMMRYELHDLSAIGQKKKRSPGAKNGLTDISENDASADGEYSQSEDDDIISVDEGDEVLIDKNNRPSSDMFRPRGWKPDLLSRGSRTSRGTTGRTSSLLSRVSNRIDEDIPPGDEEDEVENIEEVEARRAEAYNNLINSEGNRNTVSSIIQSNVTPEICREILSEQKEDGRIELSETIKRELDIPSTEALVTTLQKYTANENLKKPESASLWTTAVNLSYLKNAAAQHEGVWRDKYNKAREYLSSQIGDPETEKELLKITDEYVVDKLIKKARKSSRGSKSKDRPETEIKDDGASSVYSFASANETASKHSSKRDTPQLPWKSSTNMTNILPPEEPAIPNKTFKDVEVQTDPVVERSDSLSSKLTFGNHDTIFDANGPNYDDQNTRQSLLLPPDDNNINDNRFTLDLSSQSVQQRNVRNPQEHLSRSTHVNTETEGSQSNSQQNKNGILLNPNKLTDQVGGLDPPPRPPTGPPPSIIARPVLVDFGQQAGSPKISQSLNNLHGQKGSDDLHDSTLHSNGNRSVGVNNGTRDVHGGLSHHHTPSSGSVSTASSTSTSADATGQRPDLSHQEVGGPVTGPTGTDPNIIHAITQTMIGEYLWKYTRRNFGGEKRHKRFFWVHPYTKTLYWSNKDPGSYEPTDPKTKSGTSYFAYIEAVDQIPDNNPSPPGLYHMSLVIKTPERELKFTAPSKERHDYWYQALSYLLQRHDENGQAGQIGQGQGQTTGRLSRTGSDPWDSQHNLHTNTSPNGSLRGNNLREVKKKSSFSKLQSMFRRQETPSSLPNSPLSTEFVDGQPQQLVVPGSSQSGLDDEDEDLENVRQCCDGRHDVSKLERGPHKGHHHHHAHF